MVNFICGKKGSGKTKKLISMANDDINNVNGDIVFIESKKRHTLDLNHKIRYISAMDFNIRNIETFHGFLCGIIAEDYDIEKIYIDGLYKIVELDFYLLEKLIDDLETIEKDYKMEFIISMECSEEEVPNKMKKYLMA
ncbi:hypothetical protein GOQ27_11790 [Clostridium sp. D2Q-11]|uniref:Twitching motility protein PilT n=1 Tax=Anaeromonas frigoriresistens TaxID=2683708 RepID=A0A942UU24_9FIRM|nr:hypothetical protein [Anaeromonas frigoriresistens]MBS4539148.1 hypothetical protein [Anaeromonas frigoriresistens]